MSEKGPLLSEDQRNSGRSATSRLRQLATSRSAIDYFVGERKHFIRHSEAERLGSLEVDNEIKFGRLLDREIGWLLPS